jgi:hypothetical protein
LTPLGRGLDLTASVWSRLLVFTWSLIVEPSGAWRLNLAAYGVARGQPPTITAALGQHSEDQSWSLNLAGDNRVAAALLAQRLREIAAAIEGDLTNAHLGVYGGPKSGLHYALVMNPD